LLINSRKAALVLCKTLGRRILGHYFEKSGKYRADMPILHPSIVRLFSKNEGRKAANCLSQTIDNQFTVIKNSASVFYGTHNKTG
jgi:hypothetical protein